jgi:hypothetical protein
MQLTLEQSFAIDLELLISQYITKGMTRDAVEEALYSSVEDLFNCDSPEDGPDEQKQWYDTSAELT